MQRRGTCKRKKRATVVKVLFPVTPARAHASAALYYDYDKFRIKSDEQVIKRADKLHAPTYVQVTNILRSVRLILNRTPDIDDEHTQGPLNRLAGSS